jgi:Rieske Fe-S protein
MNSHQPPPGSGSGSHDADADADAEGRTQQIALPGQDSWPPDAPADLGRKPPDMNRMPPPAAAPAVGRHAAPAPSDAPPGSAPPQGEPWTGQPGGHWTGQPGEPWTGQPGGHWTGQPGEPWTGPPGGNPAWNSGSGGPPGGGPPPVGQPGGQPGGGPQWNSQPGYGNAHLAGQGAPPAGSQWQTPPPPVGPGNQWYGTPGPGPVHQGGSWQGQPGRPGEPAPPEHAIHGQQQQIWVPPGGAPVNHATARAVPSQSPAGPPWGQAPQGPPPVAGWQGPGQQGPGQWAVPPAAGQLSRQAEQDLHGYRAYPANPEQFATPAAQPPQTSRRAVIAGAGIAAVAGAAGFAWYVTAGPAPAATAPVGGYPAPSDGTTGSTAALAAVADIPEGGGLVLADQGVVLTREAGDDIRGFSSVCTHQGCSVSQVVGGEIICPCHGSTFSAATGAVVNGPATAPLAGVPVTVTDGSVYPG